MKVAVIGAGNMGKNHIKTYSTIPEAELVAISDLNLEEGKKLSKEFKCKFYRDYRELLQKEELDLVSIAVPTSLHKEISVEFLKKKINVLLEKPIAGSLVDAREIMDVSKKSGAKISIGHIERYNPAIIKLKELIDSEIFGRIDSLLFRRGSPFPSQIKDSDVVVDLAIHDIDLSNFLLGEIPKKVFSKSGRALCKDRNDFAGILLIYTKSYSFIESSWISPVKIRELKIMGDKAYAELDFINQTLKVFEKEKNLLECQDIPILKELPLKKEILSFMSFIEGNKKEHMLPEQAFDALKIALEINKQNS